MQTPAEPEALNAVASVQAIAALALAALVAMALALLAGALTRRLLKRIEGERFQSHLAGNATTVRAVRRVTFFLGLLVLAFPALDLAGVELTVGLHSEDLTQWLTRSGVRLLFLVFLAYAASRFAASVIRRAEREIADGTDEGDERRKRARTLGATIGRFFSILIWMIAILMGLRELGIDITPLLTGAGIVGLAVGFGAQTLVKDIISGLFLIAEDQVRIGDVVDINGIGGAVEEINLRTIVLRDAEGVVHTISNGEIRTVANRSKDFAYYVIDLGVGYDDDTDRIVEVVRDTARELMQDPAYATNVLEPLEVIGVDAFKPSEVTLRFRIKTVPLKQWEVGRELRRRIKKAFDVQGIRIPVPQMNIQLRRDRHGDEVAKAEFTPPK